MSDPPTADAVRAREEAAGWFARLSRLSVTTDTLREFRDWRREDANAAAYAKVEATWAATKGLADNPKIRAATAAALDRYPARGAAAAPRRPGMPLAVAATGILAVSAAALLWLNISAQPRYSTHVGEQRLVVLADGSHVRLNTDSAIRVRFNPRERRITLIRGEAFFEAAHNPQRPFIVEADGARVRAIGTKFDVRRDGEAVRVTLLEGRVGVAGKASGAAATLNPNQQLTVTPQGLSTPQPANAAEASGWTSGRLTFRAARLDDAIAEVNRYAPHKIVLQGPPILASQPLTGVFDTSDTAAFVAAVRGIYDLRTETAPDGSVRLLPRGAPSDG